MVEFPKKISGDAGAALEVVLEEAIAERIHIDTTDLPKAREKVVELELKRQRLGKLIESALPLLSPERRAHYVSRLKELVAEPESSRGGAVYSNVVQLFRTSEQKEWSAPAVQNALNAKGVEAGPKQIHNVLHYLEREGTLTRVSRGRYLFMGAGVVSSDIENLKHPWFRGDED